jgi:glucose/arabinose dehydrogenase
LEYLPYSNPIFITLKKYLQMKQLISTLYGVLFFTMPVFQTLAQPVLSLTPVISTGLNSPIQFVNVGDGSNRIFIVEKGGTIRLYSGNYTFVSVFLTIPGLTTAGEQGLLSLAFSPNYKTNGLFFVYYVNGSGNLEVARYKASADPTVADTASKVVVLTIPHPTNANHNGGELQFGSDGYLYLSTGDGGGSGDAANNAQNKNVLLGKILRIAVNSSATAPFYTIPAGNPFNNEVFALGLRNPFRWSFDRQTNDIWIGDVGQDAFEEVNYRAGAKTLGANYGWRCYEATAPFNTSGCLDSSNYVFPAYAYPTQNPSASVVGGVVYRGNNYLALKGYYISADFYSGHFYLITPNGGGWTTTIQSALRTGIADFGESENGELFAVALTANTVYRIASTGAVATNDPIETAENASFIHPSIITKDILHLELDEPFNTIEIIHINGQIVFEKQITQPAQPIDIPIPTLAAGIYIVRLKGQNKKRYQKIVVL